MEVVDLPILAIDMELIRVKHPFWLDFVGGGYSNESLPYSPLQIYASSGCLTLRIRNGGHEKSIPVLHTVSYCMASVLV